ncbi:sterol desaturase family protein [Rhodoflexus caldus]|uniref:sterol desaturase family protein n=1 Tax=Rhodoflexus caldus TaxID=2891236 RepID=UPI00202A79B3|nr:sterol desaturase family protein [Rhodoflexus caldus]
MELYGQILLIAMPIFLLAVLLEKWYGWYKGKDTYRNMDMISSLSSGITNVVKDVLGLSVSIITYSWMVEHLAVFKIESTVLTVIVAFVALDFSGYWVHRIAHQVNFFWNKHAIHHSSEDFNLACALRQSISSFVNLFTFFLLPAAIVGVPANVIAIVAPIHLFAQFWYHTQHIGKMGWLEHIIVTPSHHRVHHAINPEYLDKNHSQIFIIWDKLFGTFQEELPNVPAVYGITRPSATWNPIKINFQHLWLLTKDAWRAESWWDKVRIWFMPTGWRPADVAAKYPVRKIEDIYHYEKYEPESSAALKAWAWVQFAVVTTLVFYMFGNLATIGMPMLFYYGGFVFLSIYAYTELMDKNPYALVWEAIKVAYGVGVILITGDWFNMSNVFPLGKYLIIAYFVLSLAVTAWFVAIDFKRETSEKIATV